MTLTAAVCPCCAANIEIPEGRDRCFCAYCGSQILTEAALAFAKVRIEGVVQVRPADFDIEAGTLKGYRGESTAPIIPDNVHTVGEGAFAGRSIETVTIPSSVTEIKAGAFEDCARLTRVTVPSSVRVLGDEAFRGCSSLKVVDLEAPLRRIGLRAFEDCTSLAEIAIPETAETISGAAFKGCTSLERVSLPASLGQICFEAFEGCAALRDVEGYDRKWAKAFEDTPFFASTRKRRLPFG